MHIQFQLHDGSTVAFSEPAAVAGIDLHSAGYRGFALLNDPPCGNVFLLRFAEIIEIVAISVAPSAAAPHELIELPGLWLPPDTPAPDAMQLALDALGHRITHITRN